MLTGIGLTIFKQIRIGLNDSVKNTVYKTKTKKSNKKAQYIGLYIENYNNKIKYTDGNSDGNFLNRHFRGYLDEKRWIISPSLFLCLIR